MDTEWQIKPSRDLKMAVLTVLLSLCCTLFLASGQVVIPDEDWGYVTVRANAHMFWWLYGAQTSTRDALPLIMWLQVRSRTCAVLQSTFYAEYTALCVHLTLPLPRDMYLQGGPGSSGTGFGNFEELGPLNVELMAREYTWVSWSWHPFSFRHVALQ